MICPYNKSFSYVAKNICEMNFLKKKGWKKKIEISAKRKNLSEVKVAVIYQRINDNRPPERTLEKQIKILKKSLSPISYSELGGDGDHVRIHQKLRRSSYLK